MRLSHSCSYFYKLEICLFRLFHSFINEKSYDKYTNSDEYVGISWLYICTFETSSSSGITAWNPYPMAANTIFQHMAPRVVKRINLENFIRANPAWYGNKLTYGRYQSSDESGYTTMLVEIAFSCFDFFWSSRQICPMRLLANL